MAETLASLTFDLTAGPRHPAPWDVPEVTQKQEATLGRWASGKEVTCEFRGAVTPHALRVPVCPEGANRLGLAGASLGSPGIVGWALWWASLQGGTSDEAPGSQLRAAPSHLLQDPRDTQALLFPCIGVLQGAETLSVSFPAHSASTTYRSLSRLLTPQVPIPPSF